MFQKWWTKNKDNNNEEETLDDLASNVDDLDSQMTSSKVHNFKDTTSNKYKQTLTYDIPAGDFSTNSIV
jgi:hypothetical protein